MFSLFNEVPPCLCRRHGRVRRPERQQANDHQSRLSDRGNQDQGCSSSARPMRIPPGSVMLPSDHGRTGRRRACGMQPVPGPTPLHAGSQGAQGTMAGAALATRPRRAVRDRGPRAGARASAASRASQRSSPTGCGSASTRPTSTSAGSQRYSSNSHTNFHRTRSSTVAVRCCARVAKLIGSYLPTALTAQRAGNSTPGRRHGSQPRRVPGKPPHVRSYCRTRS
jgi:hypothetical protein